MSVLANYWWAILGTSLLLLWLWRSLRRVNYGGDFAPTPGSPHPPVSPARNAIGLVVLIIVLAWAGYWLARQMRVQREFCAHRYETARTAADSARLDSMKYCPKGRPPSAP